VFIFAKVRAAGERFAVIRKVKLKRA